MAQATFSLRRVRGGATRSRSTDHADGCSAATRRFSSSVRSSNSSTDWKVRISPRRAIAYGRTPRSGTPAKVTWPPAAGW
jgi:hypothetical protein